MEPIKRWWVVVGSRSWWFDELKDAKKRAKKYYDSQVFECAGNYKFLRFYNGKKI